ncbi:bifunctional 2-polyprenyl-6-hydroxyphenol methylase/3-demethylubiquinol 3-O-methyltransferase UbiG [sulfur-oxidizing endosymbiont of Gigantopelta aegis]|uniref:bifunctional 2-polyprenyl-6-hydroxyphenol methylase/3-demethylubiquinol 3-O-methyltransferase UbiG n=1 Tax=sulfur-oxidizing endosymbiont of Gigantopelta aegis TaxID=2794934 RepID=UPI0018DD4CB8|nr:bifunctional 2-polyprenyl-6-hydroxyphenol methylase/3-demethylubiquinol 3-O-methyltransferase UbiG [sulfur-oxidizing endosymbiont of Gigantopelta aegis]
MTATQAQNSTESDAKSHYNNVDPQEVAKFEAMSTRWWDREGEFKPLHDLNPARLDYIIQRANGIEGKLVLDVGCGGGILSESMAHEGANVTGIDMGDANLTIAKMHLYESGEKVTYKKITVEQLAEQQAGKYDVVTCLEMLEHVPDPASIIAACNKLVKTEGDVFFSTVNRNAKSYAMAIIGAEYIMKLLPKGTHDFKKFIRPSEMDRWIRDAGLKTQHISGMDYNPITGVCNLSSNVDINYLVHARKDIS